LDRPRQEFARWMDMRVRGFRKSSWLYGLNERCLIMHRLHIRYGYSQVVKILTTCVSHFLRKVTEITGTFHLVYNTRS